MWHRYFGKLPDVVDVLPLEMVEYMTEQLVSHLTDPEKWWKGDTTSRFVDDQFDGAPPPPEYLKYLPVEETIVG